VRIAITGISGFVGSHLAQKLLQNGHEVYGLVRPRSDNKYPTRLGYTNLHDCGPLISGDITNYYSVIKFLKASEPDIIFHLASQSFVPESMQNPLATYDVTYQGTLNVLEAMRNVCDNECKLVFAGSSEEYGQQFDSQEDYAKYVIEYGDCFPEPTHYPEIPINENNILRPQSPYAVAKLASDYACRNYYQTYGLKTVIHRCFNVEGAGRGHHFVTASIVRQLVQTKLGERDKLVIGNLESKRDWSHVDDIIDAYILLGQRGHLGEVYVSGSGKQYSIQEFIDITSDDLGIDPQIVINESLKRKTDVTNLMADASKIKQLGWEPKKFVRDIVEDLIHYYLVPQHRTNIL
jgi:GDPmannose 4,6-dehydratase